MGNAIKQIEQAIHELKKAMIDSDNKQMHVLQQAVSIIEKMESSLNS